MSSTKDYRRWAFTGTFNQDASSRKDGLFDFAVAAGSTDESRAVLLRLGEWLREPLGPDGQDINALTPRHGASAASVGLANIEASSAKLLDGPYPVGVMLMQRYGGEQGRQVGWALRIMAKAGFRRDDFVMDDAAVETLVEPIVDHVARFGAAPGHDVTAIAIRLLAAPHGITPDMIARAVHAVEQREAILEATSD